jgi:hypothetical protein
VISPNIGFGLYRIAVILLSAACFFLGGQLAAAPSSQLTAILERAVRMPRPEANERIRLFKALFSRDFDTRFQALAGLERDLHVGQAIKGEELSGQGKMALEVLHQVLKEKRIRDVNYTHAFFLFGELALPTPDNLATFLHHAESDENSEDFLPQARALSFLFQLPRKEAPPMAQGADLLALARNRKFDALSRWAFWDNDDGKLDWIRRDLREAMVEAKRLGSLKEDEAFSIAKVIFARRPAMLAEWLPFKQGDGYFEFFKAFAQTDVFSDPEEFIGKTEAIARESRVFFDHSGRKAEQWPGPLLSKEYRSSACLMIYDLMAAFLAQKSLGLLEPTQFEQQVFEIMAFSQVKQGGSFLTANAHADYTFDRSLLERKQLTEKDFRLVLAHELGHGILRLRQYEKYFEGWGAGYLRQNKDQITIGELWADVFAILQGKELGMTLQETSDHLLSFSEANFQTRGNSVKAGLHRVLGESVRLFSFIDKIRGEAHLAARQFEKTLLSKTKREEDLVDVLKFMLREYSEAVSEFRKNGKSLPKWKPFRAAALKHAIEETDHNF